MLSSSITVPTDKMILFFFMVNKYLWGMCVGGRVYVCVCAEFLNSSVATHLSCFHTLAIIHSIIVARRVLHFNYMLTLIHVSSTLEW